MAALQGSMISPKLFVDMDGVLADFDYRANQVLGVSNYKFEFTHGTDEFWRRLNAVDDFFLSFPPMLDMPYLWRAIKHLDPIVLTALPKINGEVVGSQKRSWVIKHLGPDVPVVTCRTKDKPLYCMAGDVLIDDRNVNEDRWNAAGGRFIHHADAKSTIETLKKIGTI